MQSRVWTQVAGGFDDGTPTVPSDAFYFCPFGPKKAHLLRMSGKLRVCSGLWRMGEVTGHVIRV